MTSQTDEQNWARRRSMGIATALSQSEHERISSRHPGLTREHCFLCDGETGRAGRGEDSLYSDETDEGPYCEECWVGRWLPMDTAPHDSAEIIGLFSGNEVKIRWAESRVCAGTLAGTGSVGHFGAGWEDTFNHFICFDEPEGWRAMP